MKHSAIRSLPAGKPQADNPAYIIIMTRSRTNSAPSFVFRAFSPMPKRRGKAPPQKCCADLGSAAAVVVATTAAAAAAAVVEERTVVTAAAEQENENDDPPAAAKTIRVAIHNQEPPV